MEKKFKKISTIIIILIIAIATFVLLGRLGEQDNNNQNNSQLTLSQKYSSEIYGKDIKCELLKEKEILYYDGEILILDDYTIYETAFNSDKVYSNNQQYKQIDLGIQVKRIHFKRVLYSQTQIFLESTDNKYYNFSKKDKSILEYTVVGNRFGAILKNENIKMSVENIRNLREGRYIVVKNDGQVYSQIYEYDEGRIYVKEEMVLYSNQDYGYITDIEVNSEFEVTTIISDRGIFRLKEIQTEESLKYIDVEPEYKFILSDMYTKYKDEILYMNSEFVFTKDNNILKLCK